MSIWEWKNVTWDTYLLDLLWISLGVRPHTPNAYLRAFEGALIHASQERFWKRARYGEHILDTTYIS